MQIGVPRDLAECHAKNFWTKAGTSHAQQKSVFKTGAPDLLREASQLCQMRALLLDDVQPTQPIRLIAAGPECGISRP